jgi:hypothetical protein
MKFYIFLIRSFAKSLKHRTGKSSTEDKSILDDLEGSGAGRQKTLSSSKHKPQADEDDDFYHDPYWSPLPYSAFKLLISARFAAALWTTISDCDETYNYWEPVSLIIMMLMLLIKCILICRHIISCTAKDFKLGSIRQNTPFDLILMFYSMQFLQKFMTTF